jgi:uncharacterized protein (TIGR00375 family)
MDQFRADLHIHSRYSRATSKSLNPAQLGAFAQAKGIKIVGTGDFTHPGWLAELEEHLEENGAGLLRFRQEPDWTAQIPWLPDFPFSGRPRFMLQAEISSIYKKHGLVRKIHNLVYVPDFASARALNRKLAEIGNLESDGRPILGLDSRDLLEMVLEVHPRAFLVPAHIWTPWFSLFGSKSGFNTIEECFGDLAGEVFALETGLSSDPEMNWMLSALDRFQLISNSDAHSGEKLGRECNLFSGEVGFETIYHCLRGEGLGMKFLGTVEFFPEEGKYHLDGHRKCGLVMEPRETVSRGGACPVCGRPVTVGVLNRVLELADREAPVQPPAHPGYISLIPLAEILSEILGKGPATKAVRREYARILARLGPELDVLQDVAPEEAARISGPLAEALIRMRRGQVLRTPGFDGEFGRIHVFTDAERREMQQGRFLVRTGSDPGQKAAPGRDTETRPGPGPAERDVVFNLSQKKALKAGPEPVLVVAGPGSGKTRTLIGRIRRLLDAGESHRRILAVTFTRRAAAELKQRLAALLGEDAALPRADTLHALAFDHWARAYGEAPVVMNEESARKLFAECSGLSGAALRTAWSRLSAGRERRHVPQDLAEPFARYTKRKESWNLADYTDLLEFLLEQIESGIYTSPYAHVLADEIQDFSALQTAVATALAGEQGRGFFAIGDPNQSIYGFRGSLANVEKELARTWDDLTVLALDVNYRSASGINELGRALFPSAPVLTAASSEPGVIRLFAAPDAHRETSWIAERVRRHLGSTSMTLAADEGPTLSPGDIAVLVRMRALAEPVRRTLTRLGIPCAVPEEEAFWSEPRVATILHAAGSFLGMSFGAPDPDAPSLEFPERILAQGPVGLAAYLSEVPPFDRMFFSSKAFKELKQAFAAHGGWVGLLNWINLQSELEQVRSRAERVQIMTLHAAKGLEFAAVFLPCLEEGILPFAGTDFLTGKLVPSRMEGEMDESEERRLFHVGASRASRFLYLSHAQRRRLFGRDLNLPPSRFLAELPAELLERSTLKAHTVRKSQQIHLLEP